MHKLHSDEFPVKVATVLREYETAHSDIDITIDVTLSMGGINCGTRLLSASYAQKDLDRLRHISDQSSGPPEELSDHMTWVSNTGHKEPALVLAKEIVKAYPSDLKSQPSRSVNHASDA